VLGVFGLLGHERTIERGRHGRELRFSALLGRRRFARPPARRFCSARAGGRRDLQVAADLAGEGPGDLVVAG
jgi:hypothetical protein